MQRQHIEKELIKTFEDGEIIFSEGDDSKEMFIIQDGEVTASALVNGEEVTLGTIARGEFFGEMAMLEGKPRSATCRAVGTTKVLTLKTGSFLMRLRRDPTFAFEMIQKLCGRLRQLNDRYKDLIAEHQGNQGALELLMSKSAFVDLDDEDVSALPDAVKDKITKGAAESQPEAETHAN